MHLLDFDGKYYKTVRNASFDVLGFAWGKTPKPALSYASSEKYLQMACKNTAISCIMIPEKLAGNKQLIESGKGVAISELPDAEFILLHNYLIENGCQYSNQYEDTRIGKNCRIHSMAYIADKGVIIGDNVVIEEFAVIHEGCQIGNHVTIHTGAVLGVENRNLCRDRNGRTVKLKESGCINIADGVEIGCHTDIGRGTFPYDRTQIGKNTCIDCHAVVGHNCSIAANCYISASACICGSVVIEEGVRVNPMAVIKNSITIGKDAMISIGAAVMENVAEGSRVTGNFAMEHSVFLADRLQRMRNA